MKKLLMLLLCTNFIFSMEQPDVMHELIIVDHNENQSIKTVIEKPALIAVFGATPRYSYFENYMQTLQQDYESLNSHYKKEKRLKGVERSKKEFLKHPASHQFETHIAKASDVDKMRLFFAAGLDRETLKTNIGILLKTAGKELLEKSTNKDKLENLYLTHLLLPSYFNDSALKNDPKASQKLHLFLKEAANFYKDFYTQIATDSPVKIRLIIPHLDLFITAINQAEAMDKAKINTEAIQTELVELVGSDNGFVLLNQEVEALKPIAANLQQKGTPKVAGAGIPIFNARGYASTKFNPYLLKRGSKHSYKNSPLLTKTLLEYVQNKCEDKNHD